MEDMGNDPAREAPTCGHPTIGAPDMTERATASDQYAAKHNPFVYFHSIIDSPSCRKNVVPLTGLEADLRSASRTPNLVFISPSLCHDGHDRPCRTGAVLLSRYIKPGTVSDVPYNHYSMLRSIEDIFALQHLGYAAQRGLASFGADVYGSNHH